MNIMAARPSCMRLMLESAHEDVLYVQDGNKALILEYLEHA